MFLKKFSYSNLICTRFIYFNNLLFTISKEVLYDDLFESSLKTLSKLKDIKLTKITSWNVRLSIDYRLSKESRYSQKERNQKSKKEYKNHSDAFKSNVRQKKFIQSPVGIYLLKVNNRNTRTRCEICSKLTTKTPERHHCCIYRT